MILLKSIDYSERSATTGSFFAALLDGINPAINVSRNTDGNQNDGCRNWKNRTQIVDVGEIVHQQIDGNTQQIGDKNP